MPARDTECTAWSAVPSSCQSSLPIMPRIMTQAQVQKWSVPLRRCQTGDARSVAAIELMRVRCEDPLQRLASLLRCASSGT